MSVFSVGNIEAEPGTKVSGFLPSEGLDMPDGTGNFWYIPLIIVNGADSGPVFEVDGCMHGDEQEGAYTVLELVKRLNPKKLKGTFVGIPVLNVPGFLTHDGVRGSTTDQMYVDMNRQFPGNPGSMSHTRRVIHTFWKEIILKCDYTVNLHGCMKGQVPRVVYNEELPRSLEMAEAIACTPEWIMASKSEHTRLKEGTINRACSEKGIPNVFIESGSTDKSHRAIMADVGVVVEGIMNCMKRYGMLDGDMIEPKERRSTPYYTHVRGKGAGIIYPEPCLRINNLVKEGELLCRIVDFLGNELDQVKSPHDGIVLMEPNHVSVGPESSICIIGYPPEIKRIE